VPEVPPSPAWYLVAGLCVAAGIALFVMFLLRSLGGLPQAFTRVPVPGRHEVRFSEPGSYTVFHEYRTIVGGRVTSQPAGLSGLEVRLASEPGGRPVRVRPCSARKTYSVGGRSGVGVFEFDIEKPGVYELTVTCREGGDGPKAVLAIARGFVGRLLRIIFTAIAILMVSLGLGTFLVVRTAVKRSRARRRSEPVEAT
jgi:hypothetical protein